MDPIIAADLYRYGGRVDRAAFWSAFVRHPGFRFSFFLRKGSAARRGSLRWWFYRALHRRYFFEYGFQIPLTRNIGKGLYLGHFGNVLIHSEAVLGENCNVAQGVTIGQSNRGPRKGCPRIGNRVWIGTGSVLVGNITIGDNVLISPNSYVIFDVPPNSIVMGNPAKVVFRCDDATAGYINSVLEGPPSPAAEAVAGGDERAPSQTVGAPRSSPERAES